MKKWVGVTIIIVTSMAAIAGIWYCDQNDWFIKPVETQVEEAPAIEITTYDVVAQRRLEIEVRKLDSIYYSIPEPALIAILDEIGTETSRETVVKQYATDRRYYDGLTRGAALNKHFAPDSIPRSSTPMKPMPVVNDTIRR